MSNLVENRAIASLHEMVLLRSGAPTPRVDTALDAIWNGFGDLVMREFLCRDVD
jgi:hypothetical protein